MKGHRLQSFSMLTLAGAIAWGTTRTPPREPGLEERRGPWSVQAGHGSEQRRAWVDLLAEDLPVREKDLVAFFHRERASFEEGLDPSLFYLDVWDVIGRFGMPTSMWREPSGWDGSSDWELAYEGVDITIKDEDGDAELVRALLFSFSSDGLTMLDVVIDED